MLALSDTAIAAERQIWNRTGSPVSVRLDTRELDHLAPLLGFVGDKFAEFGGRTNKSRRTQIRESRLQLGIGETCVNFPVELFDNLGFGGVLGTPRPNHPLAS